VLQEELSLLFIVDRLFHDDLVHGSAEVTNNLRQDASLVDLRAILQGFGSHSHFLDSGALFSVRFRELLKRHEVDEEVVPDLRISIDALRMRLDHSLGEDTWVLSIEEQVDPGELNVLCRAIPKTTELLSLLVVWVDEDGAPVATAAVVLAEAFAWNGRERAVLLGSVGDPLLGQPAVVLCVIEGLKREPVGRRGLWVAIVNSEFKEEFLNVEGGKKLALSVNYDLSRGLAWNWLVWLHDLGVDVGDVCSLLGVMALVDGVSAVEVLANDLAEELTLHGGLCFGMGGLGLPSDCNGAGLLLDLVDFAQSRVAGSKSGNFF
jgi:hypothetical protein